MNALAAERWQTPDADTPSLEAYVDLLRVLERSHRQLHETVAAELERAGVDDVNAVQAVLLYHMGEEPLTAAEIKASGRYLGSNVSYNLRKLIDGGRIVETRAQDGRGAPRFAPTGSGQAVRRLVAGLFERQAEAMKPVCQLRDADVRATTAALSKVERYWTDQVRFRL